MHNTTGREPGRVTVVDAIMGSGKTTWIVQEMRRRHGVAMFSDENDAPRFLYIAPTLDEVDRIGSTCPELNFIDPIPENGRKLQHLNRLIREGQNVCSTHALFRRTDRATHEALQEHRYILVIDEVLECVTRLPLNKDDQRTLFDHKMVYVDGRGCLRWNHQSWPDYTGRFEDIRNLCDNGNLAWHRGKFLIWQLPADLLPCFDEVIILTYLFKGSPMRSFFDLHRVPYEIASIVDGKLSTTEGASEAEMKRRLRELITVVDDPRLNVVGTPEGRENPLSASWFERSVKSAKGRKRVQRLQRATENFFRHHAGTPSRQNMWTTFKKAAPKLKGRGYARGFVPVNCKATNSHIERQSLAYLANVFPHPIELGYFQDHGIQVDPDAYALNEMLQWIWRSQIRRGDPITVFIPSDRMRRHFLNWLSNQASSVDESSGTEALRLSA